jgi:hypothetical protein
MFAITEFLNDNWMSELPLDSDYDDPELDEE